MTAPFLIYFVVMSREASNSGEVRFGDVAILKLFSVLHRKNSYKFSVYLLDLRFLEHMPQVTGEKKGLQSRFVKPINPSFRNRD
jgi:hypothetical protein